MKMKPLLHRVLVKEKMVEKVSTGRLIVLIDETVNKDQMAIQEGYVVEIGETAFKDYGYETPPVKIGDLVHFAQYSGYKQKVDGTDEIYRLVNDIDLFMIVEE